MAVATFVGTALAAGTALDSSNDLTPMTYADVAPRINQRYASAASHLQQAAVHAGGTGGSMTTGTLGSAPTVGNMLIAVTRRADNITVTTPPAGWVNLKSIGNSGRRLEFFGKVVAASDPTSYTFTTSGSAAWRVTLMELQGYWRTATTNYKASTGTQPIANNTLNQTTATIDPNEGFVLHIGAFANGSTISNPLISSALDSVNLDTASTQGGVSLHVPPSNFRTGSHIWSWTWTTSRTTSEAVVTLIGVGGLPPVSTAEVGLLVGSGPGAFTKGGIAMQAFDLSALPSGALITNAVLATASPIAATKTVEMRAYWFGTDTAVLTATPVLLGSDLTALDQVAHFPAGRTMQTTLTDWDTDAAMASKLVDGINVLLLAGADMETLTEPSADGTHTIASGNYSVVAQRIQLTVTYDAGPREKNFFRMVFGF